MLITTQPRRVLRQILSNCQGDEEAILEIEKLRELLAFTTEEGIELEFKFDKSKKLSWNPEKDVGKEVEVSELCFKIIRDALKSLAKQKALNLNLMPLYRMFVLNSTTEIHIKSLQRR